MYVLIDPDEATGKITSNDYKYLDFAIGLKIATDKSGKIVRAI